MLLHVLTPSCPTRRSAVLEREGRFASVSPRGALGYPATARVGRSAHELLLDPSVGDDAAASPFTARRMVEEAELWVRSAGGAEVCLLATALPLTAGSGEIGRASCRERVCQYV